MLLCMSWSFVHINWGRVPIRILLRRTSRFRSLGLQDCGEWAYSNKRGVNPSTACVICPWEPTVAWKGATFLSNSTDRASTRDDGAAASSAGYGTGWDARGDRCDAPRAGGGKQTPSRASHLIKWQRRMIPRRRRRGCSSSSWRGNRCGTSEWVRCGATDRRTSRPRSLSLSLRITWHRKGQPAEGQLPASGRPIPAACRRAVPLSTAPGLHHAFTRPSPSPHSNPPFACYIWGLTR